MTQTLTALMPRSYHDRRYMGGGQYAPSGHERDEWELFVERRTSEIEANPAEYELNELFAECSGNLDLMMGKFYPAARRLAEAEAYKKFGFAREHF